ncbi:MAG: hypothetical protein PVH64_11300 [Bacillota bacterium]
MYVELEDDELVLGDFGGCYWKKSFWGFYSPRMVHLCITSKKFVFEDTAANRVTLKVNKIVAIKKCWVGSLILILPIGIKVRMEDGSTYKLAVLLRREKMVIMRNAWQA